MLKSAWWILLLLTALPAAAQDQPMPRLGDHVFVPVMALNEPFITTHVQTSVSLGQTLDSFVPVLDVTDSTIIGIAPASVLLAGIGLNYQQAVKDWLAVRINLSTVGRVGTSTTSLISEGLTGSLGYNLSWIMRTHQSENFLLSTSLSLGNSNATIINLLDWAYGLLEGTPIPLVRSSPTLQGTAGVHAAWGLSRRFGLLGTFEMGYGESIDGIGSNQWYPDGRLAVSYDLKYDLRVPLGLALTGGVFATDESTLKGDDTWFWSTRIALQTADDFTFGLDFSGYYSESQEYQTTSKISQITIDMRYYY